jgi:hypothetical protein
MDFCVSFFVTSGLRLYLYISINILLVDLVPHSGFFDKIYFNLFKNDREEESLKEVLVNNQNFLVDPSSNAPSKLVQNNREDEEGGVVPSFQSKTVTNPTTHSFLKPQGRDSQGRRESEELRIVGQELQLEKITLDQLDLINCTSYTKKGGLGPVYLTTYKTIPVQL